jgi:hypothetical protein
MTRARVGVLLGALVTMAAGVPLWTLQLQQPAADGAVYTADGHVVRPADYREWIFLSSGLGMTYGPEQPATGRPPLFDNVFVNRESYAAFMRTGRWPERTMFILELRRGESNVSINNGGRTQGDVVGVEAAVKDTSRYADRGGWGYFNLGAGSNARSSAPVLDASASCYGCHQANAAVENTFVQFYPTLFEVAQKMGTVRPTYDPQRKP